MRGGSGLPLTAGRRTRLHQIGKGGGGHRRAPRRSRSSLFARLEEVGVPELWGVGSAGICPAPVGVSTASAWAGMDRAALGSAALAATRSACHCSMESEVQAHELGPSLIGSGNVPCAITWPGVGTRYPPRGRFARCAPPRRHHASALLDHLHLRWFAGMVFVPSSQLRSSRGHPVQRPSTPMPALQRPHFSVPAAGPPRSRPRPRAEVACAARWRAGHHRSAPAAAQGMHSWTYTRKGIAIISAELRASRAILGRLGAK